LTGGVGGSIPVGKGEGHGKKRGRFFKVNFIIRVEKDAYGKKKEGKKNIAKKKEKNKTRH